MYPSIGMPRIGDGEAEIKIDEKRENPVHLVLSVRLVSELGL